MQVQTTMLLKLGFTANSHHNPFLCSYPEGFGCAAQKVHNRKASSHVFATKARFSARLSNRADITAGMRASMSPFIYINHFNLIFLYIFLGLWRFYCFESLEKMCVFQMTEN